MTELLYQTDSYLREFDAVVIAADNENRSITLDRSAFYPGGGGQPADRGVLLIGDRRLPIAKASPMVCSQYMIL